MLTLVFVVSVHLAFGRNLSQKQAVDPSLKEKGPGVGSLYCYPKAFKQARMQTRKAGGAGFL